MKLFDVNAKFSDNGYLGLRHKNISKFSGEEFREKYLEPILGYNYDEEELLFDFDNCRTTPQSFLSEAFEVFFRDHPNKGDKIMSSIKIRLNKKGRKEWLFNKINRHTYKINKIEDLFV